MLQIKSSFVVLLQYILRVFPVNNNKILSLSYNGQGYGDNGKYVCSEIIKHNKNILIIWPFKKGYRINEHIPNVKAVRYLSLFYFYHLVTSKVWISNLRMASFICKRPNQYYIQLWHGMPALKRIEKDAQDALPNSYIQAAKHDSQMADLFISNSQYWTNFIRNTFWYDGPVLECGTPRIDSLINRTADSKQRIKDKLHITADKVVLYAPTFRKDMNLDCYSLDYQNLKHTLETKTGKSWHVCVRLHPNVTNKGITLPQLEGVTDFSQYPDMYELMEMADLLITDYSSTMFEAGFAGIPVILFATDIEKYRKDRNFYFKFEELPFPVVRSNAALFEKIKNWNTDDYMHALAKFKDKLGIRETGTASKQLAEHIIKIMTN